MDNLLALSGSCCAAGNKKLKDDVNKGEALRRTRDVN